MSGVYDFSRYTEEQAIEMMYPAQKEAYLACRNGYKDTLVVGSGGYGKSFIIEALRYYTRDQTIVTGSTGVAAINVRGATAHSTLSLPLGIPTKKDMEKVGKRYRSIFKRNHPVKNIIIDEFSMVGVDTLDSILQRRNRVSKTANGNTKVRLLMFCDFFQLPAVIDWKIKDLLEEKYGTKKMICSDLFKNMDMEIFELDQNKRSGDDKIFTEKLLNVREGLDLENTLEYFNDYVREPDPSAVYLTPTNAGADAINKGVFDKNPNPIMYYYAYETGEYPVKDRRVPDTISFKEGLRIMSVFNDRSDEDLFVNGSCGEIIALYDDGVEVAFDNGNTVTIVPETEEAVEYYTDTAGELHKTVVGTYTQIGLKQCSAVSIHKSQGLTLDKVVLDLEGGGSFECGQTYVALSRLTSIKGLYLTQPLSFSDIKVDRDVKEFYANLRGEEYNREEDLCGLPSKYHKYKIRLLVAGGRDFKDENYAFQALDFMLKNYNPTEVFIIEGGALGADRLGRQYAISRGIDYDTFEADWKDLTAKPCKIKRNAYGEYNCLAGLVRNKVMGDLASHGVVFWDGFSTGSSHMIEYMEELKKPVKIFKY